MTSEWFRGYDKDIGDHKLPHTVITPEFHKAFPVDDGALCEKALAPLIRIWDLAPLIIIEHRESAALINSFRNNSRTLFQFVNDVYGSASSSRQNETT